MKIDYDLLIEAYNYGQFADEHNQPQALPVRQAIRAYCEELEDKYSPVLIPFTELMRKELHANAGKGDRPAWIKMSADEAILELYYHIGKLHKAVRHNDGPGIREYSADVANISMMILDICGGLYADS